MNEEEYTLDVELHSHLAEKSSLAIDITESYDFQLLMEDLKERASNGETMSNLVATAVMTLFGPSFVLIGSPHLEPTEGGIMVPEDVGICLSTSNDITPSGLAYILKHMSIAIDTTVDKTLEELRVEDAE